MPEANEFNVDVDILNLAIDMYESFLPSGPSSTVLAVLAIGLLVTAVTTLYCIQSYPQEDLEAGVNTRFRILVVIYISGAIALYVIQIYRAQYSITLVAIAAILYIARVVVRPVRPSLHRARSWVLQSLEQPLSWVRTVQIRWDGGERNLALLQDKLLYVKQSVEVVVNWCTAFLGRINQTARQLFGGDPDLAPGRNDTNLGDMAV